MNKIVLFIFSPFASHLTKTTLIAKSYASKGTKVVYCLFRNGSWHQGKTYADLIVTDSEPVGFNPVDPSYFSASMSARQRIAKKQLEQRQRELREIVGRLSPDVVFFDELCMYDYFLISDLIIDSKKIVLIPTLPNCPGTTIPPLDAQGKPGIHWIWKWKLIQIEYTIKDYVNRWYNPLKSSSWTISHSINADKKYDYSFYSNHYPVVKGLKRWYESASEFDFYDRKLPKDEKAVGPLIDIDRIEFTHPRVDFFLKKHQIEVDSKLIYCGFGLAIRTYLKDEVLLAFYRKLNELASRNPQWNILVSVPPDLMNTILPSGFNIMFVEFVPQIKVLPKSDLFITHGGGSVMEAIMYGVPMMSLPVFNKLDFNGNTARIEYHGLGLKATFEDTIEGLEVKMKTILGDNSYKRNVLQLSSEIDQRYGDSNLQWLDLP